MTIKLNPTCFNWNTEILRMINQDGTGSYTIWTPLTVFTINIQSISNQYPVTWQNRVDSISKKPSPTHFSFGVMYTVWIFHELMFWYLIKDREQSVNAGWIPLTSSKLLTAGTLCLVRFYENSTSKVNLLREDNSFYNRGQPAKVYTESQAACSI